MMKRILNFLCLSIALVSCGTVNNMSPGQEKKIFLYSDWNRYGQKMSPFL